MNARKEKEEFVAALDMLATDGKIGELAVFHAQATDEGDRQLIEDALLRGVEICGIAGWMHLVDPFTKKENLSDAVLIKIIEACEKNGSEKPFADILFRRENLSDAVLIRAIEACEENGWTKHHVPRLFKKENLSDPVLIKMIEACGNCGMILTINKLWRDPSTAAKLSDAVKGQIETSLLVGLEVCGRKCRLDKIASLLTAENQENLSEPLKEKAEASLLEGIEICRTFANIVPVVEMISIFSENEYPSDAVKEKAEAALVELIESCGQHGHINALLNALSTLKAALKRDNELREKVEGPAEVSITKAFDVCATKDSEESENEITSALLNGQLKGAAMAKAIEICGNHGKILTLAYFDLKRTIPAHPADDTVKDKLEAALLKGIEVCEKEGQKGSISHFLRPESFFNIAVQAAAKAALGRLNAAAAAEAKKAEEAAAAAKKPQDVVREYLAKKSASLSDGELQKPQRVPNRQEGAQAQPKAQPNKR